MTVKSIQLSRKLVLQNEEDAKSFQVERWYNDYFNELNVQLEFLGIQSGHTTSIPNQLALNAHLNTIFGQRFAYAFDQNKPFVDLNGIAFEIESLNLVSKTFVKDKSPWRMFIFLITKPLELVDSFGTMMVFKTPGAADGKPLLSVELDSLTTIHSIAEM